MNQKVYDIILKVKNTAYEKDTIRLLEYIFQDINNNLIATKINKLENEIKSLDPSKTPMYEIAKKKEILNTRIRAYSILKKELKTIIVSDNSIITYLDELLTDNNIGYINDIFKTFSSFFIILDHHLYENLNPFSFIFNVYIILATYHYNKENAKNFYKILKVCQQIHPFDLEENLSQRNFYNPEYDYRNELTFAEKKDLFDSLISIEEYSEYDIFDDVISAFLDLVSTTNSDDLIRIYKKRIELAKEIIKDKKELEQNKFLYKTINDQEIITALFKTKNLETFHYNKSILVNDHYKYLQENLKKIENNANIQKEIQDKILNINPIIFDYLTKLFSTPNHQEDYFIILLDIVFDSDSYFELNNKINTLITESQNLENKSKVFNENYKDELLAKLNSLELKEKRKNKLIMYEKSSKVPIVKPNTITERMQELYQSIYKDWITNINLFKYYGDHCDNLTDRQSKLNNDVIVIEKEIENRKKEKKNTILNYLKNILLILKMN